MTIEIVKKQMEKLLRWAHTPDFSAKSCYHMAMGAALMASNTALELNDIKLSMAIDKLWDNHYRKLFLQVYREELACQ